VLVPQGGADGWSLQGTKVTLEGATCTAIGTGGASSVTVEDGCATVR
jgi:hypothetical protein